MARQCPPGTIPYTVRPGDTLFGLAERFGTTLAAIISANPHVDPDSLRVGQRLCVPRQRQFPPCPEGNFYTIQPGDTLFSIARAFGVSLDDLVEANPFVDPERLMVGEVICIPLAVAPRVCPPGTTPHVIAAGETFFSLARRFGISVEDIVEANPGIDPDRLLIGQTICIPRSP